ncbi:hypothetical protein JB92DRAFT_3108760 [Gautieria morchelliformis]|nr:hypothetical protein JB92DRAFT_3108760 [Gautieria morchelliformis]
MSDEREIPIGEVDAELTQAEREAEEWIKALQEKRRLAQERKTATEKKWQEDAKKAKAERKAQAEAGRVAEEAGQAEEAKKAEEAQEAKEARKAKETQEAKKRALKAKANKAQKARGPVELCRKDTVKNNWQSYESTCIHNSAYSNSDAREPELEPVDTYAPTNSGQPTGSDSALWK